jgi:hypothetical protein
MLSKISDNFWYCEVSDFELTVSIDPLTVTAFVELSILTIVITSPAAGREGSVTVTAKEEAFTSTSVFTVEFSVIEALTDITAVNAVMGGNCMYNY